MRRICTLNIVSIAFVAATMLSSFTPSARAAIEPRSILKTYFESGDVPTQDQFANLIDSFIHQTDDGLTLVGIGVDTSSGSVVAGRKFEDDVIDITLAYAPPASHPPIAPDWTGHSGFLPLEYQDSVGQPHFGFLQMSMDADTVPPSSTGPAIRVDYWAWESNANTPVIATAVPEPTGALAVIAGIGLLIKRKRRQRTRNGSHLQTEEQACTCEIAA
jgi:hypothetical protein